MAIYPLLLEYEYSFYGVVQDMYDEMFGDGTWEDDYQKYNERLVEWTRPTYDFMLRSDLSTKL